MEVVADTGWFECGTALDRLKEQEEDDACFWSEDGFECDTALDRLKEEEDANACLWSEDGFEGNSILTCLKGTGC